LALIKEDELKVYERNFNYQILAMRAQRKMPTKPCPPVPVALIAKVFFHSWRRDVDTILFCDLLQKTGVIENDRLIRIKHIDGTKIDKDNPRVEFGIYTIGPNAGENTWSRDALKSS
jgi:Holliday junction resolvase RusA-like endonuclease